MLLANDIRRLVDHAAAGGAESAWLENVAKDLVRLQLSVPELWRLLDPRKRRTLERASQLLDEIERYKRNGDKSAVATARKRTGIPKTTFHRRLKVARDLREKGLIR